MSEWTHERPHEWSDDASCKGVDSYIFEYQEKDSELCEDMNYVVRAKFNALNFREAKSICSSCPVRAECWEFATDNDKFWTVRSGRDPGRFKHEAKSAEIAIYGRTCARGHFIPHGGVCMPCKALNKRMSRRRDASGQTGDQSV